MTSAATAILDVTPMTETRAFKTSCEVRDTESGPTIVGYAAVFNSDSLDMGFIEQVDPGAFSKTLQEADVRGLFNHDSNWLLGRSKAGTLRLSVDRTGLRYEIDVNAQDPDGQRAIAKVRRGDCDGSSFTFQTIRDEWNWEASPPQRRLLEVSLVDVGPVTYPAYPDATAAARALEPVASRVGRPVDELVTALRSGEIRSLLKEATVPTSRAITPVPGTLVWGPEDGFQDLLVDITELLPAGYYAMDVSVDRTKALVCGWEPDERWVVEVTVGPDGEPSAVAPQDQWVTVEQGWVQVPEEPLERAFHLIREARAADMTESGSALQAISDAHDQLMAAAKGLRDLIAAAKGEHPAESELAPRTLTVDIEARMRGFAMRADEYDLDRSAVR
jgi:HK97 family phage prohead protease